MSLKEFVSRQIRAIALCIPTVHHVTREMHARNDLPSLWFGYPQMKGHFTSFEALSTTYRKGTVAKKAWCLRI